MGEGKSSKGPFSVLVFTKTCGYRHDSIPAGVAGLKRLAENSAPSRLPFPIASDEATDPESPLFTVAHSEDAEAYFKPGVLSSFRVVVLLQVSGTFLDRAQLDALRGFVDGGGGVVGIHCASTGMPPGTAETREVDPDEWYARVLIGGVFTEHPPPQDGRVVAEDPGHPVLATGGLALKAFTRAGRGGGDGEGGGEAARVSPPPGREEMEWRLHDEWYNFRANPRRESAGPLDGQARPVDVLLSVDEASYEGGKLGADHPIAWCRELNRNGGRSFYTALGHFDELYSDETFMGQILNAILWAAKVIP